VAAEGDNTIRSARAWSLGSKKNSLEGVREKNIIKIISWERLMRMYSPPL